MLKTFGLIVAGLTAGLAIALVLPGDDVVSGDGAERAGDFLTSAPAVVPDERFAGLQEALRAETQARLMLEERVEALSAELAALREGGSRVTRAADLIQSSQSSEQRDGARTLLTVRAPLSAEERLAREEEREIERIVEAGFSRDRAEYIRRRSGELDFEVLQAVYEARRTGEPVDSVPSRDQRLRRELGDDEYERLLRATGRLMDVSVLSVMSGSPAERAGFKPGDRIVSYAGTRLFEIGELNQLNAQGNPGETVIIEVLRDGQPVQLALPRGPMGVQLTGTRSGDTGPADFPGGRGGVGR